jgi:hypothetical protein
MDDFPKDKDKFALFFPSTTNKKPRGPPKAVVELNITSAQNLASLKKPSTAFFKYIQEKKIWLRQHKFDTIDLQSIGFFTDRSTEFTWNTSYENEIRSKLKACIAEELASSTPGNVINTEQAETPPEFELTSRRISHSYRGDSGRRIDVYTQAYEIRCENIHKNRLIVLLTSNSDKDHHGTFIPYSMAKSDPVGFGDQIRKQTRFLDKLKMIAVYGLSRQVMESPTLDSDNPTFRHSG